MSAPEYLPADAGMGICFSFREPLIYAGEESRAHYVINGPVTTTMQLQLPRDVEVIGVRFHPGMAYAFLQEPVAEYRQQLTPSSAVEKRLSLPQVTEQLHQLGHWSERISCLDRWLQSVLAGHNQADISPRPELDFALDYLRHNTDAGAISALVQQCDLSQRQLERIFQQWVGMTPKRYSQLMRVGTAKLNLKQAGQRLSLADQAALVEYADQSHFSRDFKAVTGLTPGQYQRLVQQQPTA